MKNEKNKPESEVSDATTKVKNTATADTSSDDSPSKKDPEIEDRPGKPRRKS